MPRGGDALSPHHYRRAMCTRDDRGRPVVPCLVCSRHPRLFCFVCSSLIHVLVFVPSVSPRDVHRVKNKFKKSPLPGRVFPSVCLLARVVVVSLPFFLWCLAIYMSSRRRRFLDAANTSSRRRPNRRRFYYELWPATRLAGCTDTRVHPITGASNPPATRQVTCSNPVPPYPWPWSCQCRSRAAAANPRHHRDFIKCLPTTRRRTRDEGTLSPVRSIPFQPQETIDEDGSRVLLLSSSSTYKQTTSSTTKLFKKILKFENILALRVCCGRRDEL